LLLVDVRDWSVGGGPVGAAHVREYDPSWDVSMAVSVNKQTNKGKWLYRFSFQ
jgi:hypothetical protein